jgi:hypothetical protein
MHSFAAKCCWLVLGWPLLASSALHAQSTIGEVFASDASVRGAVILSGNGTQVLSGSQVSAGEAAAVLKLARGGEVRICPKTNLSLSADASGKSLVVGMNAGAMEVDYALPAAADSILTPDFRLQLISPGNFHFALSVTASGDTCLHSLEGSDAAVFVAEMMGTESYQLSPGKNVLFKAGRISGASEAPRSCGCPETKAELPPKLELPAAKEAPQAVASQEVAHRSTPAGEGHLEVDTGFVYRGEKEVQDYSATVARLSISHDDSKLALALLPQVKGPEMAESKPPAQKKPGVLHRFTSFLGRLFGK